MKREDLEAALRLAAFNDDGLVPAIVQEEVSNRVLMLAWMDAEAMRRTFTEGLVTFWSRSRQEYWRKGDTSGNHLHLLHAAFDCDADVLLLTVQAVEAACHTGAHSCFDINPLPVSQRGSRS